MAFRVPISVRPTFLLRKPKNLPSCYLAEVIAGKTIVRDSSCWDWTGWCHPQGYGNFKINGKTYRVHRLVYELCVARVPNGKLILHSCDNPPCCNPTHLFLGDEKDNIIDCLKKGRLPSAILTEDEVKEIITDTSSKNPVKRTYNHYKYLASKYKVSVETIKGIVYGKTWGHIRDGHGSASIESFD